MSDHWSLPGDYPESDRVASVSDTAFRLFTTLVLQADDEGRGRASARRWGARANVRGDAVTAFQELVDVGLVVIYQHGGREWFFLPGRFQHNESKRWWASSDAPLPPDELLLKNPEYLAGLSMITSKGRLAQKLGKNETRRYPHLWDLLEAAGECWRVLENDGTPHIDVDVDIEEDSSSSSSSCKESQCSGEPLHAHARKAVQPDPPASADPVLASLPADLSPTILGEDYWPALHPDKTPTADQLSLLHVIAREASDTQRCRITVAAAAASARAIPLDRIAGFTATKNWLKAKARHNGTTSTQERPRASPPPLDPSVLEPLTDEEREASARTLEEIRNGRKV